MNVLRLLFKKGTWLIFGLLKEIFSFIFLSPAHMQGSNKQEKKASQEMKLGVEPLVCLPNPVIIPPPVVPVPMPLFEFEVERLRQEAEIKKAQREEELAEMGPMVLPPDEEDKVKYTAHNKYERESFKRWCETRQIKANGERETEAERKDRSDRQHKKYPHMFEETV